MSKNVLLLEKLDRNFVSCILHYISHVDDQPRESTTVNWSANCVKKKVTMKFFKENVAFVFFVKIIHLS